MMFSIIKILALRFIDLPQSPSIVAVTSLYRKASPVHSIQIKSRSNRPLSVSDTRITGYVSSLAMWCPFDPPGLYFKLRLHIALIALSLLPRLSLRIQQHEVRHFSILRSNLVKYINNPEVIQSGVP